jgi:5-methylcytosine-specific restriction enzyme subunit McrC
MSRTLHLTERRPRLCRLPPAEIDFLLARHRTALEVLPTRRRHVYRLTPAGLAGVIVTPRRRIVISSKVPLRNLFLFLDPLAELPEQRDLVRPDDGSAMIDLLAGRLAARMAERGAAGLHRAYRETANQGAWLVGQLDLAAQVRQPSGRKDQIFSRQDEYTVNVPCNQAPAAIATRLIESGVLSPVVRDRLTGALAAFADVEQPPLTADFLARLQRDPPPPGYGPLIDLCRLLIDALGPTTHDGRQPAPAFLLPLERLFEQYLTATLRQAFGEHRVHEQTTFPACESVPGQPDLHIRPDVAIERKGRVRLVVDAKWKRLAARAFTEDLYQVLAYCSTLPAPLGVLVYPGRRRVQEYSFAPIGARVQIRTLDVGGTLEQCARARRRLGRDLRRLLAGVQG